MVGAEEHRVKVLGYSGLGYADPIAFSMFVNNFKEKFAIDKFVFL